MTQGKEIVGGFMGGVVGGALATFGLMKIGKAAITSNKTTISQLLIGAGATVTLLPQTTYKFAVILFHGDGDHQVQLSIKVDNTTYTLYGDEQAIELLANQSITITATNTDTTSSHISPTIEIVYLTW
jgi:hypothetical protein